MRRAMRPATFLVSLSLLLIASMLLSLVTGVIPVSFEDAFQAFTSMFSGDTTLYHSQQHAIVVSIRLPRILLAVFVGAGMAVCGTAMQGLFKNGLADPALIGVSGGASLGASVAILLSSTILAGSGFSSGIFESVLSQLNEAHYVLAHKYLVSSMAFLGGLAATAMVYRLGASSSGMSVATMLLAGIAITALAGAFSNLCTYLADDIALRRMSIWRMGSMSSTDWPDLVVAGSFIGFVLIVMPRFGRVLNALLLGESEARHLGFNVSAVKWQLIALTALAMGAAVSSAGVIGFVGLVVPHIVRMIIGPDHRYLIPGSMLLGASLLVLADLGARTFLAPEELPVGIITAIIGAPFFIALLLKQRRLLNI